MEKYKDTFLFPVTSHIIVMKQIMGETQEQVPKYQLKATVQNSVYFFKICWLTVLRKMWSLK